MVSVDEECAHGDMPEVCPPCQSAKAAERAKLVRGEKGARFFGTRAPGPTHHRTPRAITAEYPGECEECGGDIRAGITQIVKMYGVWIHEECV